MRMLQMLVLPLIVSSLITGEQSFLVLSAKTMLVVRVLLCVPTAGVGIRWDNSDKPTAVVTMIYTHTPADSVVGKRSRRPFAFSLDWERHNVVFLVPNS